MARIVTIDGCAGVGKSAVAHEIAMRNKMYHISMGTIFRAITWCDIREINYDTEKLKVFFYNDGRYPKVYFDHKEITEQLYNDEMLERCISNISSNNVCQDYAYSLVKSGLYDNMIVEGRNSKHFFPEADKHIFLYADICQRNKRSKTIETTIKENINTIRDYSDINRNVGALVVDSEYYLFDSSDYTLEETVIELEKILEYRDQNNLDISVITTVYGTKRNINDYLQAIKQQTLHESNYEIVLVTDCENAIEDDRINNIIHSDLKSKGLAYARNIGINNAKGEVLVFLDADMIVNPEYLENHLYYHQKTNNLLILGSRKHLKKDETIYSNNLNDRRESRDVLLSLYSEDISYFSKPWAICYGCNISIRKQNALQEMFNTNFGGWGLEDIEWGYRQYKRGMNIIYSEEVFGYHKFHERNMSIEKYENWKRNLNYMISCHGDIDIKKFQIFSCVFDPDISANYMEIFELFNQTIRNEVLVLITIKGSINEILSKMQKMICSNSNMDYLFIVESEILFFIKLFANYFHDISNTNYMVFKHTTWEKNRNIICDNYKSILHKEI